MKQYIVFTKETLAGHVVVQAKNEYEARKIVFTQIQESRFQPETIISERHRINHVKEIY